MYITPVEDNVGHADYPAGRRIMLYVMLYDIVVNMLYVCHITVYTLLGRFRTVFRDREKHPACTCQRQRRPRRMTRRPPKNAEPAVVVAVFCFCLFDPFVSVPVLLYYLYIYIYVK